MNRTIDGKTRSVISTSTNGKGTAHGSTEPESGAQSPRSDELNGVISRVARNEVDVSSPEIESTQNSPGKAKRTRAIIILSVAIVLLVVSAFALRYWLNARHYVSTDDAFIEGRTVEISPKVSGYVKKIYVTDNQEVREGDLLVEIDPVDYEAKVDE